MGNSAPTNTISTFDHSPNPNQSRKSGRNTSRGVAFKAVTKGSNRASKVGDRPSRIPSGSPAAIAMASPSAKAVALTHSGCQISPVANMFHSVAAIRAGVVEKSYMPGESVRRGGASAKTRSTSANVPAPRREGSRLSQGRAAPVSPSSATAPSATIASVSRIFLLPYPPGKCGALGPAQPFREHHRDEHDDQDAGEHPIEREQIAEARDGIADAFRGGEALRDQHPDERAPDADAGAGHELRKHA